MSVQDILNHKGPRVVTVARSMPLSEAVAILVDEHIGALVVSDNGEQVDGILSERDIVRAVATGTVNNAGIKVQDLMTSNVITCTPEDSVDHLSNTMNSHHIRHMPIVKGDVLEGLISVRDVIDYRMKQIEMEREQLTNYINS